MSMQWLYGLAIAGALAGCARNADEYGGAPFADDENKAEAALNQRVTIVGQVDEVRGEQTFTLKYNRLTPMNDQLLVIAEQPVRQITMGRAVVFRGEWLKVYGMVRRLSAADMQRTFGFALDPDLAVRYDNQPVVVTRWISEPQSGS